MLSSSFTLLYILISTGIIQNVNISKKIDDILYNQLLLEIIKEKKEKDAKNNENS